MVVGQACQQLHNVAVHFTQICTPGQALSCTACWQTRTPLLPAAAAATCLQLLPGVIPIAHNSGGPRADIVVDLESDEGPQRTGYLAETKEEYCSAIKTVSPACSCSVFCLAYAQCTVPQMCMSTFRTNYCSAIITVRPAVFA
jgi:hypothetical protein